MIAATARNATSTVTTNPFLFDVVAGLSAEQKQLSPKYFYDDAGSRYFDEICLLDEYYPYRTELKLLEQVAAELSEQLDSTISVVEFGAGSLKKIEPLLRHITCINEFLPIDISGTHLSEAASRLAERFPKLAITPIQADFTECVNLNGSRERLLGFFPGSTIGNFEPTQALQFLRNARYTLGPNGKLLIGVDTKKSPDVLHRAYNDSRGVTAKFNLNILERINKELDANINTKQFEHYAYYNPELGCVQMHLISLSQQTCQISEHEFDFDKGESIHTENSFKYTPREFTELAARAGWQVERTWLAQGNMFSTFLLGNSEC